MDYNITYRDKDGGIQAIVSYKQDGRWKQKSKQGFKKKGDAKDWANDTVDDLKESLKADLSIENKGITFKEFTDKFLKDMENHKERNTIINYKNAISKFSDLNDTAMQDVTFMDIQEVVNEMVKSGLKLSVVKLHLSRIKTIFNRATKKPYKVIAKSPVDDDIMLPREKEEYKIKALTKTELDDLLSKIVKPKDHLMTLIASHCGLRLGELLGLTWDSIDKNKKVIRVNKQWKRNKDNKYGLGTVKGKNSNREVPLPQNVLEELGKYKANNPTDLNNRIFLNKSRTDTSNRMSELYKKNGYDITIHDLRHTYATMLIGNGVDFKTAAEFLGHDVEMTMKIYSHVNEEMRNRATNIVNSIF
jgi:integrase